MANVIVLSVTDHTNTVDVILNDPIGPSVVSNK
jgi:hypothetical protein